MSMFFARAKINESLIVETFGRPISVARAWSLDPFPCCRLTRAFNVGKQAINFKIHNIITKDGEDATLSMTASFKINTETKSEILKAYKKFSDLKDDAENIETSVIETLQKSAARQGARMTLEELKNFTWLFTDIVFMESKDALRDKAIILVSVDLEQIAKVEQDVPETIAEEEVFIEVREDDVQAEPNFDGIIYEEAEPENLTGEPLDSNPESENTASKPEIVLNGDGITYEDAEPDQVSSEPLEPETKHKDTQNSNGSIKIRLHSGGEVVKVLSYNENDVHIQHDN